jgi:YD repeat-containing protein
MDYQVASCNAIPDSLPYFINVTNADSVTCLNHLDTVPPANLTQRLDTFANMERHVNLTHLQYLQYRLRSFSGPGNLCRKCDSLAEVSADTALKPIFRLQDEFQILPIETSQWRDNRLTHATFNKYDTSLNPVGFVYPDRTQLINLQALSGTFTPAAISGNTITKDSRYLDETLYQFSTGNPQQVTPHSGITNAYIWDYQNQQPIAKATNTAVSQIAYTSFEANGSGSWTIGSGYRDTGSITGNQCYNLNYGACSRSGLTSANSYVVSYWSKTGNSYTVSGSTAVVQGKTIGGWTYFEHTVSGVSTLSVSGTGDIDELRLYPSTAQMTTYTYTPLVGMTSQCDADNRVTYYQYDALGRMKVVLDQDHNIIKTVQYHYQGQ